MLADVKLFPPGQMDYGDAKIKRILEYQGYSEKRIAFFKYSLLTIFAKIGGGSKTNTMLLHGKASAGKSALAESFIRSYFGCSFGQPDNNIRSSFIWNDCVGVRAILWEEPSMTGESVEDCKKIFGGQAHVVNAKYKSGVEVPPTPVMLTSNKGLAAIAPYGHYDALKTRCVVFNFPKSIDDDLEFKLDWPVTKMDWMHFFHSSPTVWEQVQAKKFVYAS